jgi:hypothetical protein
MCEAFKLKGIYTCVIFNENYHNFILTHGSVTSSDKGLILFRKLLDQTLLNENQLKTF